MPPPVFKVTMPLASEVRVLALELVWALLPRMYSPFTKAMPGRHFMQQMHACQKILRQNERWSLCFNKKSNYRNISRRK